MFPNGRSLKQFTIEKMKQKKFKNRMEFSTFLNQCKKEHDQQVLHLFKDPVMNVPIDQVNPVSYDLFDTLIFRICKEPHGVFDLIGKEINDPEFTKKRQYAEYSISQRQPHVLFEDIYNEYFRLYGGDIDYLKHLEFDTECQMCFPNLELCSKIKQGDIIVSDMYYSHDQLKRLLSKMDEKIVVNETILNDKDRRPNTKLTSLNLYVSFAGKGQGYIWSQIKEQVVMHIGDNHYSDILQTQKFRGIQTFHYTNCIQFSPLEEQVARENRLIALGMRFLRLTNPFLPNSLYSNVYVEQYRYNVPLLSLIASYLYSFHPQSFGLILRDCFVLKMYLDFFFPDHRCGYLNVSRNSFSNGDKMTTEYILQNIKKYDHLFDIHATGYQLSIFFPKHNMMKKLYTFQICHVHNFPFVESIIQPEKNKPWTQGWFMEIMNLAPFGSFSSKTHNGLYRSKNETPDEFTRIIMLASTKFFTCMSLLQPLHSTVHYSKEIQNILLQNCPSHFALQDNFESEIHSKTNIYLQPDNVHFISYYKNSTEKVFNTNIFSNIFGSVSLYPYTEDILPSLILNKLQHMKDGEFLYFQESDLFQKPYLFFDSSNHMIDLIQIIMDISSFNDISVIISRLDSSFKHHCLKNCETLPDCPLLDTTRLIVKKSNVSLKIIRDWDQLCIEHSIQKNKERMALLQYCMLKSYFNRPNNVALLKNDRFLKENLDLISII